MIIVIGGKPILPDGPLAKLIEGLAYSKHNEPSCETCKYWETNKRNLLAEANGFCGMPARTPGGPFIPLSHDSLITVATHFCAAWEAK